MTVRVSPNDAQEGRDEIWWKSLILSKHPNRKSLLYSIMIGKPSGDEFHFKCKEWWLNDKRHRKDKPAIEWANGSREWCLNGTIHRKDGPDVEFVKGHKE